jgi:hypothetical protein
MRPSRAGGDRPMSDYDGIDAAQAHLAELGHEAEAAHPAATRGPARRRPVTRNGPPAQGGPPGASMYEADTDTHIHPGQRGFSIGAGEQVADASSIDDRPDEDGGDRFAADGGAP